MLSLARTPLLAEVPDEAARESCLHVVHLMRKLLRPPIVSEPLQPFQQVTQRVSPCSIVVPFFFLVSFGSGKWSSSAQRRLLLLRVFAGAGAESSRIESCDTDVEDVLVVELEDPVDKPGTTRSTEFSVLRCIFLPFQIRCGF